MTDNDRKNDLFNNVLTMWGIQDSLLQAYRGIFLNSQSILIGIATAVIVFPNGHKASCVLIGLSILGIIVTVLWRSACVSRGKDVWFFQKYIFKLERGDTDVPDDIFTKFKDWQKTEKKTDKKFAKQAQGETRKKLDSWIPWSFFFAWVFVLAYGIWLLV